MSISQPIAIAGPRPRVLIAERDAYAADLAEYLLEAEGYEVWDALDVESARAAFAEGAPDAVHTDLLSSETGDRYSAGPSCVALWNTYRRRVMEEVLAR